VWLVVAVIVQFVIITALALVVLSLARQVGILHERTAPAALSRGGESALAIGEQLSPTTLESLSGREIVLSPDDAETRLLLFIAADCPVCRTVIPAYHRALQADSTLNGLWVGDGADPTRFVAYLDEQGIDADAALESRALGLELGIREMPALVILGAGNRLRLREVLRGPRQLAQALSQFANPEGENTA
jgi:hypothetical protein